MQITGPIVGTVTLTLISNASTPTDLATFNDVVGILDQKTGSLSPTEQELQFLNTWVLNNPNYPSVAATTETTETTAEIASIDIGESSR